MRPGISASSGMASGLTSSSRCSADSPSRRHQHGVALGLQLDAQRARGLRRVVHDEHDLAHGGRLVRRRQLIHVLRRARAGLQRRQILPGKAIHGGGEAVRLSAIAGGSRAACGAVLSAGKAWPRRAGGTSSTATCGGRSSTRAAAVSTPLRQRELGHPFQLQLLFAARRAAPLVTGLSTRPGSRCSPACWPGSRRRWPRP